MTPRTGKGQPVDWEWGIKFLQPVVNAWSSDNMIQDREKISKGPLTCQRRAVYT
jgi:hypothetical protein